jgi:hypothetical protein
MEIAGSARIIDPKNAVVERLVASHPETDRERGRRQRQLLAIPSA